MRIFWLLLLPLAGLTGCESMTLQDSSSLIDPQRFLVNYVCEDGGMPLFDHCKIQVPQTESMPVIYRRYDPQHGVVSDAFVREESDYTGLPAWRAPEAPFETTWSYTPFLGAVAAHGDGGETYTVAQDGSVRIVETRAGGPNQFFNARRGGPPDVTPASCGDTGWVPFTRGNTQEGEVSWTVARLGIAGSGSACPPGHHDAYTEWTLLPITYPFMVFDRPEKVSVRTIVSDHYAASVPWLATEMERSFWAEGYGRLIWDLYKPEVPADPGAVAAACPASAAHSVPPAGWYLWDCLETLHFVPWFEEWTMAQYGWP